MSPDQQPQPALCVRSLAFRRPTASLTAGVDCLGYRPSSAGREIKPVVRACSSVWARMSARFVESWDSRTDLSTNNRLSRECDRAEQGIVSLTGEVSPHDGDSRCTLSLGPGRNFKEAGQRALIKLTEGFEIDEREYVGQWLDSTPMAGRGPRRFR